MSKLVFVPVWMRVAVELLQGKPLVRIAYKLEVSSAHIYNITKEMVNRGWLIMTKTGRTNEYKFTEKGEKIAAAVQKMLDLM